MSCPDQVASSTTSSEHRLILSRRWESLGGPTENPVAAFHDGSGRVLHGDGQRVVVLDETTRHVLGEHEKLVSTVAVSTDGRFALSGSYDKTVTFWDLQTSRRVWSQRKHTNHVRCVTFMPGYTVGLSGGHDGKVRLWDLASGRSVRILKHTMIQTVEAIAVSHDRRRLFAACGRYLAVWDLERHEVGLLREYPAWWRGVRSTEARGLFLQSVAVLGPERLLLRSGGRHTGGVNYEGWLLLVVDTLRGEETSVVRDQPTNAAVPLGDGSMIVTSLGRHLRLINLADATELHRLELTEDLAVDRHSQGVRTLSAGPGGSWFVAGMGAGAVLRFDVVRIDR